MNEQKSIYACYEEIKQREINELKERLAANGGSYIFKNEMPCVMCNLNRFDCGPSDVVITSAKISDKGNLVIEGYLKDGLGDTFKVRVSEIAYGHLDFITSSIPVKEAKRKIWLRLGVTIIGTPEEIELLFDEDKGDDTLENIIQKGQFVADGESYIPEACVESYNIDYGTEHSVGDYDFNL